MQESSCYNTVEIVSNIPVAIQESWNYAGVGTCPSVSTSLLVGASPGPAQVESWYDVKSGFEYTRNRRANGKTHNKTGLPFRMTSYEHHSEYIFNFLTRRLYTNPTAHQIFRQFGTNYKKPGYACGLVRSSETRTDIDVSHYVVTHTDGSTPAYTVNSFDADELSDAEQKVRTSLAEKTLTQWDVLTDMAEAKELPSLVKDVSKSLLTIIRSMHGKFDPRLVKAFSRHRIIDLLKHPDKMVRILGKEWMQYRYGIMPLVYSYRDAMKAVQRGTVIRERSAQVVLPRATSIVLPTSAHIKVETDGYVRFSGTSIQRFSSRSLAKLSAMGTNPLATLWELVPYSFVFDWFVNVGDYINAHTAQSYADESLACISRHDHYTTSRYRYFTGSSVNRTSPAKYWNYPRYGTTPVAVTGPPIQYAAEYQLRQQIVVDRYVRNPISLRDVALRFNPSLNWKRLTDAAVMSNGLLKEGYSKFIYNALSPAFNIIAKGKRRWRQRIRQDDANDWNYSDHVSLD